MENTVIVIFIFVFLAAILMFVWQNVTSKRILELLRNGKNQLPDERYFELKYKIQYMTFASALIVVFIGTLGLDTFKSIKLDLQKQLKQVVEDYTNDIRSMGNNSSSRIDSLLDIRIDRTNKEFFKTYESMNKDMIDGYEHLMKEISSYNDKLKNLNDKVGYNRFYVINDLTLARDAINVISFANMGFKNLKLPPTLFISPKSDFDFIIRKITLENCEVEIKNARSDSVSISMLIYN